MPAALMPPCVLQWHPSCGPYGPAGSSALRPSARKLHRAAFGASGKGPHVAARLLCPRLLRRPPASCIAPAGAASAERAAATSALALLAGGTHHAVPPRAAPYAISEDRRLLRSWTLLRRGMGRISGLEPACDLQHAHRTPPVYCGAMEGPRRLVKCPLLLLACGPSMDPDVLVPTPARPPTPASQSLLPPKEESTLPPPQSGCIA